MKKQVRAPVKPATAAPRPPTHEERAIVQALKEKITQKTLAQPKKAATILTGWLNQPLPKKNKKAA